MDSGLIPINDNIVVELVDDLEFIVTPDKPYATRTRGICIHAPYDDLLNKLVFFEDFKDGAQVEHNGKKYAFIKYSDIRGYKNV